MFYKVIEEFKEIIKDFEIKDYKRFGTARALVGKIEFIDGTVLHIRDYLFLGGRRKYSYQWQNKNGDLIIRWDNSPHHSHLKTFPNHQHVNDRVIESEATDLRAIMEIIKERIEK